MASPNARRRQRSTRLTVAVVLLVVAAALVAVAFVGSAAWFQLLAAVAAVVLGAAATRITHSELVQTRRDAARDRAEQAQAYRVITEQRTAENAAFAADMSARIAEREDAITDLESALSAAQKSAADATRKFNAEARRAELADKRTVELTSALEASEARAAEAIVLVAELEVEIDALRAELVAWQATGEARKHA
jgi:endonuclease/exonuclease/phosphatase (EEP) superfamily protein YafD